MESSSLLLPISKKSVPALILLFLLINFFDDFRSEAQVLPDDEVRTLQQIQTKLNIKMWGNVDPNYCSKTKSFSSSKDSNTLNNVTCDCTYNASTICHVTSIQLRGMNLTGVLPDEFANLTHLQQIDLARNYLNGTFPRSWTTLPLVKLSVLGNIVSGQIPIEIGDIATLEELILEDNLFEGPLPRELGKLSRLSRFLASGNNFNGTLPETFGDLKNLTTLIDGTSISGRIPSFIGNWTQMERLDMQGTSMEGPIPANISLLINLRTLKVSDLNISSMTLPGLQAQTQMEELILRNCSINGSIPSDIDEVMPKLARLDLSYNRLSGNIPGSLEQSSSLRYMYLNNNSLTGTVPTWILSTGYNFDISYNNFTGSSKSTCRENNLNRISIYSSLEDKSIDWCLKKDLPCPRKPKYHNLFINCGGPRLFFEGEYYEQNIDKMGATSFISTDKWACSSTGTFVGDQNTDYIARATTNISGGDLYSTARLAPNSLRYFGLCLRKGSYTVKLHFAEIMITDDQTSARRFFDVSIQGKRILKDYNIAERAGGVGKSKVETYIANVTGSTLEIHLYWSGKGTTAIPYRSVYGPLISAITVTPNFDPHSGGLSVGTIVGIVAASCVVVVLVLVILWKKGYLGGKDNEDKELRAGLELHTGYFSLRQIKAATGNFDHANKIGEGGFGAVYKGVLSDGSIIAVKQLSSKSKQGNREFVNEIGMISALQHPNLVRLIGCCIEGNQLLLIYEYMENNSLARALFGREEEKLNLDWPTRLKICMGIARGLAYLHEESRLKIVHRDIKATNVLLDRDLNAKISDFGLAKLVEEENSHISTRVAGTIGYMAPEYAMRGYLTDKADVYSFGVVALEIVSGKSNTNFRPIEKIVYLLDWAYVLQEQGNLLELVDPSLGAMYSKEEALRMLNVGLLCTNLSPTLRPTMSAVVSMLDGQAPIQAPPAKHGSMTNDIMFKAFENISQDSQTQISSSSHDSRMQSMSTDGTWIDSSSVTFYSIEETKEHSSTNKLLPDLYEVNLI